MQEHEQKQAIISCYFYRENISTQEREEKQTQELKLSFFLLLRSLHRFFSPWRQDSNIYRQVVPRFAPSQDKLFTFVKWDPYEDNFVAWYSYTRILSCSSTLQLNSGALVVCVFAHHNIWLSFEKNGVDCR